MPKNTFVAEVTFKVCVCMSLQCHFQNQLYIIYSVKRDDPDYGITEEELTLSEDETESDFENLFFRYRRVKNIVVMKEPF